MEISAPRGTKDVLPEEAPRWRFVEEMFRRICSSYGYEEIRTPVFEYTELFVRGVGEGTDIVSKEMYTFLDKGGRSITLKPEGTAPVVRAYIEHHLGSQGSVAKLYYITPIFRYERPQAGRLRQAHQVGVEVFGPASPLADAEVIQLTLAFYEAIGLTGLELRLNSLGDAECRRRYRQALLDYAQKYVDSLPEDAAARMRNNPLRLLDSKDPDCLEAMKDAPSILDYLEPESREHFDVLLELLEELGIPFVLDQRLVRGLDYYNRTVFEVVSDRLGAQNSVCGGGRYDGLVEICGGPHTPAVGVAMGIERALMLLDPRVCPSGAKPTAFLISVGADMSRKALKLATELRRAGIPVDMDLEARSAKSQFRQADRSGARFAVVLGEEEWERSAVVLRDLCAQSQTEVPISELASALTD